MNIFIPRFTDLIDILIVAIILYRLYILIKKMGGYQILIGAVFVFVVYILANIFHLNMVISFLNVFKDYWVILFIILFQQEIRNLFSKLAHNQSLQSIFSNRKVSVLSPLLNAISIMSFRKIGALIVIENNQNLNEYIRSGEIIDSKISVKLILTIFNNKTILHDGALIVRNDRIYAVKVVLPLSENIEYTQKFGTRHLAAIGISEKTDAFVIVVSEETREISVVKNGKITTDIKIDELSQRIKDETTK